MALLKKEGLARVSPPALFLLEKNLKSDLTAKIGYLKQELMIKGRRTLKKEDVQEAWKEKEDFSWEI